MNLVGFLIGGAVVWPGSCRDCVDKHRIAVAFALLCLALFAVYLALS